MKIVIVDDDPVQCRLFKGMLQNSATKRKAATVAMPLVLVRGLDGARIDCVILDLMLPDLDGLGVLARMRHAGIAVPVVVQTAHGGIDNVVSALGAGEIDFGSSRSAPKRLLVSLRSALNPARSKRAQSHQKGAAAVRSAFIITKSPAM